MSESAAPFQPDRSRAPGPVYAALDLGTNNCRLLVAAPTPDGFRVVDSFSRIVRLGEGLQTSGRLCEVAMDRAIGALHGCAQRLARRPVRGLRAIATEACRRASNGREFLARVSRETGLPIEIITAREEAELALESCAPLLEEAGRTQGVGRRALLFDIGGGSTEIAWIRLAPAEGCGPQLIGTISLPVGVVTLAERFGHAGFEPEGFDAMVADVLARIQNFEAVHCIRQEIRQGGVHFVGTSGTVTTLAGIVLDLPRYSRLAVDGAILTHDEAQIALARLRALGRKGLSEHPCVGPDRAEFVLPGCAIFAAIQQLWPAPHVLVADRGLREGMLLRMMRNDRGRHR